MASYVATKAVEAQGQNQPVGPREQPAAVGGPVPSYNYVQPPPINGKDKKLLDAYILALGLGFLGAHHFYLRRPGFAFLYLFTFGLFGVGYLVDLFRLPYLVKEANRQIHDNGPKDAPRKSLADAYLLWFPCGLFGFHHFYLRRWGWGVAYLLTFGLLGIGWLIDAIRMKKLVEEANLKLEQRPYDPTCSLSDAYVMCLFPLTGLLGVHHYYLRRPLFGVLYTLTLGLLGVGWLVDICRLSCLVKRTNKKIMEGDDRRKYLDDAYLCLFPLGFLGLHHFYLRRPGWGVLYMLTVGVFGIGWLIDFCRLPCLVNDYNDQTSERTAILDPTVVSPGCVNPTVIVGPGLYPPSYHQGAYSYPPPPQYLPSSPANPPAGVDSMSSIVSSEVGHETPGMNTYYCPPSYQEATGDKGHANANS